MKWAEKIDLTLTTGFIPGKNNAIADALSRSNQVLPSEWTLHHEVCSRLWSLWGLPVVDLFATRENYRIQAFVSPLPDPMAVATDALTFPWEGLHVYAFPPYSMIRLVLNRLFLSPGTRMTLVVPFWPSKEWWPDLLTLAIDQPRRLPLRRDLLKQPHFARYHRSLRNLNLTAWLLSPTSSRGTRDP